MTTQPSAPPPNEDMAAMINWFNEKGYEADIPALRQQHPGLLSFEDWLKASGWSGNG